MALKRNARKKDFEYYLTNLDWDDGTPIDRSIHQFTRNDVFDHTYERPGFYSIKGLVFKYAPVPLDITPESKDNMSEDYTTVSNTYFNGHPSEGTAWYYVESKNPVAEYTSSLVDVRFRRNFDDANFQIGEPYKGDNEVSVEGQEFASDFHDGDMIDLTFYVPESWSNTIVASLPRRASGDRMPGIQIKIPIKLDIATTDYFYYSFEANLPNPNIEQTAGDPISEGDPKFSLIRKSNYLITENVYPPRLISGSDGAVDVEDVDWSKRFTSSRIVQGKGGHSDRNDRDTRVEDKGWQKISGYVFAQERDAVDSNGADISKLDYDNNYATIVITPERWEDTQQGIYHNDPDLDYKNNEYMAIRNLSIKVPNSKNIIRPIEWQRFYSNIVVNPRDDYQSPLYELNDFAMIGGVSKKSSHFKTLTSLTAFDIDNQNYKNNSLVGQYNVYDVLALYDTMAKYDEKYYNDILDPYISEVYEDYSPNWGEYRYDSDIGYSQYTKKSLYNKPKIHDGVIDESFHGVFKDTEIVDIDVSTTKVHEGVIPLWKQMGLQEENNVPTEQIYWKNIIPKDYKLTDRSGFSQEPLEDPTKGSITPRIPRLVWVIDEENNQTWNGDYYWPQLPKMTRGGVFSEPIDLEQYGAGIITTDTPIDETLFNLTFDADDVEELLDITDNYNIEYRVDGLLDLNENGRVDLVTRDITDTLEKDFNRQAF